MDTLDRLLSVQDLADYLGVPVATIYAWRHRGDGPTGFRVGKYVRYQMSDVQEWIEGQLEQVGRQAGVDVDLYGHRARERLPKE